MIALAAASWAQSTPDDGPEWLDRATDPADPARRAALREDGALWVSQDGGGTWIEALPAPPPPAAPELELAPIDLPNPARVEDGEVDPEDYEAAVRRAVDEARRDRVRAVDELRGAEAPALGRTWFDGGALWVVRDDGPHASLDGGRTWVDRSPERIPAPLPEAVPVERALPGGPPLDALVQGALDQAPSTSPRPRRFARYLPSLVIELERYTRVDRGWEGLLPDGGSSLGWTQGSARLEWGLGRVSAPSEPELDLVRVDGRWLLDDGADDPILAGAIRRHAAGAAADRVEVVRRLYAARASLIAACGRAEPPRDRAVRAVRIEELEARLDALSGGAWTGSVGEGEMWWWCGVAEAEPPVEQVLERFASEPDVREVQRWAVARIEASPEQVRRWLAQSRSAAWLPELSVDWRMRDDWDQGYGYFGPGGVDPIPGEDLAAVPEDVGRSWTRELQVGARWQLDELVSSSNRIRMIGEAQDLAELRDKVEAEVTRLYFERRRLQVEDLLSPPIDPGTAARDRLRIDELTASLDAATGGAFSRSLAEGGPPG